MYSTYPLIQENHKLRISKQTAYKNTENKQIQFPQFQILPKKQKNKTLCMQERLHLTEIKIFSSYFLHYQIAFLRVF